jgi:mono/diheme cytochrome c family protein
VQDAHYKDESDFRDLVREPRRLFGYSYLYFLGALLLLGMLYAWNLNLVGRNAIAPAALKDSTAFVQDIPLQSPAVLPPVDVMKAGVASDSLIARGRDVFRANCVSCHGDEGRGDGPTAATLNPKPRNFHTLSGWTNGSKISEIYRTLQEGIVKNGMAAYNYLPPVDRFALAHYVRRFASGQPQDSPADLQLLETTYQLAKGSRTAGQIPVKRAMQIVLSEDSASIRKIREEALRALTGEGDAGVVMIREYSTDPVRTIAGFVSRKGGVPPLNEFVRMVSAAPASFGFKPGVTRLSDAEWKTLQEAVSRLVSA